MPGIFDKLVGEVKSRVNAVKAGNQETTGLGNELAERAKMQRAALGSPARHPTNLLRLRRLEKR